MEADNNNENHAGFWVRIGSGIIDGYIISLFIVIVLSLIARLIHSSLSLIS